MVRLLMICLLSLFPMRAYCLGASIVESPSLLAQLVAQYQKYVEMIEKAQAQVDKLNAINDVMNKANSLMEKDGLKIANPMEVIENLNSTIESIKYNAERLKRTAQDWDISQNIRRRNLQEKCPFLDLESIDTESTKIELTKVGEETPLQADINAMLTEFTDITAHNISSINNSIKGLPLAMLMCERLKNYENAIKTVEIDNKMKESLLNGDFEEYKRQEQEKIKQIVAQDKKDQQEMEKKLAPLKIRMEQMKLSLGVTDPSLASKHNVEYCRKTKSGGCDPILLSLDYVKNQEKEMLEKAQKNSNGDKSQSQADREFIMIDYLREIATHISFLNETMAMTANVIAEEQEKMAMQGKNKLDDERYKDKTQILQEQINQNANAVLLSEKQPKLDEFGFPTF